MASSKEFLNFILEQVSSLDGVSSRMMMGEYIIYVNGVIVAYICDNQLLAKPAVVCKEMLPNAPMIPPYKGARDMVFVEDVDDAQGLKQLFVAIYEELRFVKSKKITSD